MKKRTLAVAAFAVVAFAGCLKNEGAINTPRAGVLVDLLSPNATNTTVILNGNTIGSNVSYGSVPQYYNQVTPGPGNLAIYSSTNAELLNTNFPTISGEYYSIFVVDSVSKMKSIIVSDSVGYPNSADTVKVRFYNFAPNSPALNIVLADSGAAVNYLSLHSFETQGTASGSNVFRVLKAGTHRFQVFTPSNTTVPLADTSMSLDGKHIYTMFIKGFYADTAGTTKLGLGIVKHG